MDEETVKEDVKDYISSFSNMPAEVILDTYILKKHPLMLIGMKLDSLALQLREYVKEYDPSETVLLKEVRKKGLSVSGLCTLIYKKVKDKE